MNLALLCYTQRRRNNSPGPNFFWTNAYSLRKALITNGRGWCWVLVVPDGCQPYLGLHWTGSVLWGITIEQLQPILMILMLIAVMMMTMMTSWCSSTGCIKIDMMAVAFRNWCRGKKKMMVMMMPIEWWWYIYYDGVSVCLCVTKNDHFLLGVSCNHLNPP